MLYRLSHQLPERLVADTDLVQTDQQLRQLRERRYRFTRQDRRGDDRPEPKLAIRDENRSGRDHRHLDHLLHRLGHVSRQVGTVFGLFGDIRLALEDLP